MTQPTHYGYRVDWQTAYRQGVLDFVGANPDDPDSVVIDYQDGYSYGGDTGLIYPSMTVSWVEGGGARSVHIDGEPIEGDLSIYDLAASFAPPLEDEFWDDEDETSPGASNE